MTLSTTMLQSDLDYMIADLATSVTWNGTAYSCIVGDIGKSHELEIAGISGSATLTVVISKDDFSSYPAIGDRVTISAINYRVIDTSDSPDGISRTLTCAGDTE